MRIPVVLWVISFVVDLGSLRWGPEAVRASFYFVATGVALAIVIAATSMLDYNRAAALNASRGYTYAHAVTLVATLVVFALDAWVRATAFDAPYVPLSGISLTALGLVLIGFADYLRRQIAFDRKGTIIRLVRDTEEDAPEGVIPFRRPRRQ